MTVILAKGGILREWMLITSEVTWLAIWNVEMTVQKLYNTLRIFLEILHFFTKWIQFLDDPARPQVDRWISTNALESNLIFWVTLYRTFQKRYVPSSEMEIAIKIDKISFFWVELEYVEEHKMYYLYMWVLTNRVLNFDLFLYMNSRWTPIFGPI